MDIRKVKKLIEMMQASDITEIEVRDGDDAVKIIRGALSDASDSTAQSVLPSGSRPRLQAYASMESAPNFLCAPTDGIFSRASVDGIKAHQRLGEIVAAGDQLGAIKTGDQHVPICAAEAGLLMAMFVEEGARVSKGDRLFQLRQG